MPHWRNIKRNRLLYKNGNIPRDFVATETVEIFGNPVPGGYYDRCPMRIAYRNMQRTLEPNGHDLAYNYNCTDFVWSFVPR